MYKAAEIIAFFDRNKPITWGLFLSTIIFKFAMANILLAILGAVFILQIVQRDKIILNKNLLPIVLYVLWGIASLLWTTNLENTIQGVSASLPLLIVPVLISQYSNFDVNDFGKTIKVFSYCLLGYFVVCLVNAGILYMEDGYSSHFFYHNLVSVFKNNAIYISLAVAICILIGVNLPKKSTWDYLVTALLGVFLLALSSKNIITTTLLLTILTLLLHKRNYKRVALISIGLVTIVLALGVIDNPVKTRFLSALNVNLQHVWTGQDFYSYAFSGFEIRFFQWRILWEMIQNNQVGFFGLGLHNVDYLLNQYFSYYNLYKGYFYINFHNQYLQTLGELGFIGVVLLLVVLAQCLYRALKYSNKFELLFVVLFMVAFFTESYFARQKGIFLFATLYSLIYKFRFERPVLKTRQNENF